jgi:hypothetical protein
MPRKNENPGYQQPPNNDQSDDVIKPSVEDSANDVEKDPDELVHEGKLNETKKENEELDPDELVHSLKPRPEQNEGERDIDDLMHR